MKAYIPQSARIGVRLFISMLYLFLYVPIIVLVIFSFNKAPFPSPWVGFTFEWYHQLINTPSLWQACYTSLIIAFCAMSLTLVITLAFIFYLTCTKRSSSWLLRLFYTNIIVPEVVMAVALLSFFTFFSIPLGISTLIIAHTGLGIGYSIPIIYARYNEIDRRLLEASHDLGATTVETFFYVIIPLLQPALIVTGLLVFVLSFDDFILSYFCAGGSSQTLSLYILSLLRSGITPVINALSAVLLTVTSVIIILVYIVNFRSKNFLTHDKK